MILSQSLKGKITDKHGVEIPFAKIRINNTSYGTVANAIGNYVLELHEGKHEISVSAAGFQTRTEILNIHSSFNDYNFILETEIQEIQEVVIVGKTSKERGKEIMKEVIEKRPYFYNLVSEYSCDTYCFTSLEKDKLDSIFKDSIVGKEKLNLIEWRAKTSYKKQKKFKDEFYAFNDFSDPKKQFNGVSVSFQSGSNTSISPTIGQQNDPYMFVSSIRDAHINIFENLIEAPKLTPNPIVSPLAFNAFIYYNFYLENSFIDTDSSFVYEIKVKPRFEQEALFDGTLFVRDNSWEIVSYQFAINPGALLYFKEIILICDYQKIEEKIVPNRREFIYNIKEGKTLINGLIRLNHSDYSFKVDDSKKNFWLETATYTDDAFDKDTNFWNAKRPFTLKEIEKRFIHQQDSIITYHESDEYLKKMDSIRNEFKFLNLIFGDIGRVNSFKKYEFSIGGLIQQIVPFGVGGYRHRLNVRYTKEFKNAKSFSVNPYIDYGFLNKDIKGSFGGSFTYNPKKFSKIGFEFGDVYDFINNYQNIQGTLAPGNRVRNKKIELNHRHEVFNGFYLQIATLYSNRKSIEGIVYPDWMTGFGIFQEPQTFEAYKIFMTTIDFEYHFKQKYIIRKNKKLVLGSPWPTINLQYKKGIPNVFAAQSDFDYLELRVHDEIKLNTLGVSELKFISGMFLQKKDLRLIENRFFRTSDPIFFSNPINSLQLLDTALNTANSFTQFNFIHHFNGFFLNKIWLINRLKLEETVGGGLLIIPNTKFAQAEFYIGLERKFRIRKEVFKIGFYVVTADNNFEKANIQYKIGLNFFNSFTQKWDY